MEEIDTNDHQPINYTRIPPMNNTHQHSLFPEYNNGIPPGNWLPRRSDKQAEADRLERQRAAVAIQKQATLLYKLINLYHFSDSEIAEVAKEIDCSIPDLYRIRREYMSKTEYHFPRQDSGVSASPNSMSRWM